MLKLAKWRVGLLEPFPTLPPASKASAAQEGRYCIWAEFFSQAFEIYFSIPLCAPHMEMSGFFSKRLYKKSAPYVSLSVLLSAPGVEEIFKSFYLS